MGYLLFNADKKGFNNGEGNEVSLEEHLDYLDAFGGTPDCWVNVDTENLNEAMKLARQSGLHLYVVDERCYTVAGVVNKPE